MNTVSHQDFDIGDRLATHRAVERPLGRVLAHRTVLGQIVANLLTNALKFTRPETPPRVRIHAERGPDRLRLWVEDNGIGIAPEHRERIFRAFERLHGMPVPGEQKPQGKG